MLKGDRGVTPMISWVLLVGLSVIIGVFIFNWMRGTVGSHSQDLARRAETSSYCQGIGMRLERICQNTQTLNINLTNTNNLKIGTLKVRMVDVYGKVQLREINTTIRPEETKEARIVKQGIIQKVEIIPGSGKIICQSRSISQEGVGMC